MDQTENLISLGPVVAATAAATKYALNEAAGASLLGRSAETALLQLEVGAPPLGASAVAEPREAAKGDAEDAAHGKVRVLREGHADVEEDLFKGRDGELGLDVERVLGDLGDGLEDGGAAGDDGVAGGGLVPVAAVLDWGRKYVSKRFDKCLNAVMSEFGGRVLDE